MNQDWERFGEDIRRTVQQAIDSRDFGRLNQTITDTVNDAVDTIARNIRNTAQSYSYGREDSAGRTEARARSHLCERRQPGKNLPRLYRRISSVKAGGTIMTALGMATGGIFSVLLLFFGAGAFITGMAGAGQIVVMAVFLILAAAGFVAGGCGNGIRARAKRFQTYLQVIGQREYCNIRELSKAVKKSVKYVVRDLEDMLARGWFLQGHLDEQKTCLIVTDGMYRQYRQIEAERRQNELDMAKWQRQEEWKNKKQRRKDIKKASRQKDYGQENCGQTAAGDGSGKSRVDEKQRRKELPPQVREVIEEGDAYISRIHACNEAVSGGEISAKISRMEMLVDRIFDRVEQNPESVDDIHKLMEYYLPTTVKLLEAYQELDAQPVEGENIRSSKREIEATLDTLNMAFEKLLDGMFQETAWDVSSDISVLQMLLAQEGLTDDGLHAN